MYSCAHLAGLPGNWWSMKSRKATDLFAYFLIELLTIDCFTLGDLLWVPVKKISRERRLSQLSINPRAIVCLEVIWKQEAKFSVDMHPLMAGETQAACTDRLFHYCLVPFGCWFLWLLVRYLTLAIDENNIFSKKLAQEPCWSLCWTGLLCTSGLILNYLKSETQNLSCCSHCMPGPLSDMEKSLQT